MKIHYHSDHLGSASFVTNREGAVMQHLQYLPYGELFVSQRNTEEFDSRYKFTAKELDNETSYTYFGARYYDSELSGWLSVDPMSDKYPSLSPYCYSANNPVVLVDPNLNLEGGQYIPQQFTTDNGQKVNVDFSYITKDGNNAYNAISIEAVSQFIMGINEANNTGSNINKIGISATTNGEHSSSSRHYIGKAIDICTINNQQVGKSKETYNLQNAMNKINKIRENFSPYIKTKNGKDWYVPGHDNHIHISVN